MNDAEPQRRVLYVVHYPVFGGPHNIALRLAAPLADRGWALNVLLPDEPGNAIQRFERAGVPVRQLELSRLRARPGVVNPFAGLNATRDDVRRIRRLLREDEIDVVVVGGLVNPQSALAAHAEDVAVVWQILDTRTPRALRYALAPVVVSLADIVMTTGRRVAELHPGLRRLGDRSIPFHCPVDLEQFKPDRAQSRRARLELGFPDDAVVIGTIGNLSPMKRHGDFIEAAAALRSTHPNTRFAILGAAYDYRPRYTASLLRRAAELGLEPGVDLVVRDPVERAAELAPAFDVFWMSSDRHSEGVPTAIGEAMALELPIVTTDAGGVAEVVEGAEVGYVVPARQPHALAHATRALVDSEDLRSALGKAGREQARELFALERNAEIHDRALSAALERNRVRLAARLRARPERSNDVDDLLRTLLVCPTCRGQLAWGASSTRCERCATTHPVVEGIPVLVMNTADPHKSAQASYFASVDAQYEITRPHETPRLHQWLLGEKFSRGVSAISDSLSDASVLTVCGGSGMDAEYLARAGARVIVSDISLAAAQRARRRAALYGLPITSVVADIEALPFADRSLDLVYVHDGLHHLEQPSAGLAEMTRVAARAVSVNEPARAVATRFALRLGLAEEVEEAGNRIERLDPDDLARQLRASGFRIVKCERYAMRYRHEPGLSMRLFSTRWLFGLAKLAIGTFNAAAGSVGNKLTIQATR